MRRLAAGVLAAIVLGTAVASSEPPRAIEAAVVRRDGGLLPIGTFTGKKWEVSWPWEPLEQLDIPVTLDAVPHGWWGRLGRRNEWQLWADGVARGPVHLVGPRVVPTLCTPRMALATDYRSPDAPPLNVQPYPKAGIAVSPPASVGRVEILDATSPEWQGIGAPLGQAFDDEEDQLAAAWMFANDPHPIPRKERIQTPLTIEAMYASGAQGDRLYYVEASRKYDHSNDERALCAVAFGNAFFRRDGDKIRALGGDMKVVPCDRRGLVYMMPFGTLQLNKRTFWLTQFSGWDYEQYNIIEFKKTRIDVAASTFGGRCDVNQGVRD